VEEVGGLHDGGAAGEGVGAVLQGFARGDAGLARGYAVGGAEAFVYYCGLGSWLVSQSADGIWGCEFTRYGRASSWGSETS